MGGIILQILSLHLTSNWFLLPRFVCKIVFDIFQTDLQIGEKIQFYQFD